MELIGLIMKFLNWRRIDLGQVSTEYLLATGMFMVIFVGFYQIIQDSLKNLFRQIAFVILSSYK